MKKDKPKTGWGWVKWAAVAYGTGRWGWQYEEVRPPFTKKDEEYFGDEKSSHPYPENVYRIDVVRIKHPPKEYLLNLAKRKELDAVSCAEAAKRYKKLANTINVKKVKV